MLFLTLFTACLSSILSTSDPMCDAMCDTQYTYDYTTSLESYTLLLSFSTEDGEVEEYINFTGTEEEFYFENNDASVRLNSDSFSINLPYGQTVENVEIQINDSSMTPMNEKLDTMGVCGTVCENNTYTIDTDYVEEDLCAAICIETEMYMFSTELTEYTAVVTVHDESGSDTVEISYDGHYTETYGENTGSFIAGNALYIQVGSDWGFPIEDVEIEINGIEVEPTNSVYGEEEVCGTICDYNTHEIDTSEL